MLCFTQKTTIWAPSHLDTKYCTGACRWQREPAWRLHASVAHILVANAERDVQNAKVAPRCLCGASEFCVEIISLFSCHLGSGCWRVARARCFMGNTTERHLQQMFMGRARNLSADLQSDNLYPSLQGKPQMKLWFFSLQQVYPENLNKKYFFTTLASFYNSPSPPSNNSSKEQCNLWGAGSS